MKVTVSYISSMYEPLETIKLINDTNADGVHVDLMDGIYAGNKNFDIDTLIELFKDNNKPLDVHMMVNSPSMYLDKIIAIAPDCIYIHPSTEQGLIGILNKIGSQEIKKGIAINPNENIEDFIHYFPYVDRVLLMSVIPGAGGQKFLEDTPKRLEELNKHKNENNFEIFVDGGINPENVKLISTADGIISGSFICKSNNFQEQIDKLRKEMV